MAGGGLEPVPDPSGMFLGDRRPGIPGTVTLEADAISPIDTYRER